MALHEVHYFSPAILRHTCLWVVVPQGRGPLPVVYQLHGRSDDASAWLRRTTIEMQAERIGCIVAMLWGGRSYYLDDPTRAHFWERHILDSVALVDATFKTVAGRRGRGIGGNSMGGYGALHLALKHPRLFGSVAAHSGAVDPAWIMRGPGWGVPQLREDVQRAFAGRVGRDQDLFQLARSAKPRPRIHFDCGTGDFLLPANRKLHAHLERHRIPHAYHEHPGGHDWTYWQARLDQAFDHHAASFAPPRPRKN